MVRIVYEDGLEAVAKRIAEGLGGDAMKLENAVEAPCTLEGVDTIGLVYFKQGKDIGDDVVRFVRQSMGSIELKGLQYLFSICVCRDGAGTKEAKASDGTKDARPQYALKVMNRLFSSIGCLPSYSKAVPFGDEEALEKVCRELSKGAIRLAYGSPFVGLYMKANKNRFRA